MSQQAAKWSELEGGPRGGRDLLLLARGWRPTLFFAALLGLGQVAAALALPPAVALLVRAVLEAPGRIAWLVLCLAGLVGLHAGLGFAREFLLARVEARVAARLRDALYRRIQAASLPWLERQRTGALATLFAVDVEAAAAFATRAAPSLVPLLILAAGALAFMAHIDPWVAAAVGLAAPAAGLLARRIARPLASLTASVAHAQGDLLSLLQENLDRMLTIKAFGQEDQECARQERASAAVCAALEAHQRCHGLVGPGTQWASAMAAIAVVTLATLRPGAVIAAPDLVALVLFALLLARPLSGVAQLYAQLLQARAAARRLAEVWRAARERPGTRGQAPRASRGAVSFQRVALRYPGRPPTLRGFDLELRPGELVALVGPNGAGKTSLAQLLLRLREPDAGRVQLDGRDVAEIDLAVLRENVGLATQHTQLFDRSIRDNIAYGLPGATPAQVECAARRVGIHAFVAGLPLGYETRVGEDGLRLSGGQRQRIALARVVLREPVVLVLDEATSQFDAEGELAFLEGNRDWLARRTVLLISHRPASLRLADRVVELRHGRAHEETSGTARTAQARGPVPILVTGSSR